MSDPEKRAVYDRYGEEGLKDMPIGGSGGGNSNGNASKPSHKFNPRKAEDIFSEMFGANPFTSVNNASFSRSKSTRTPYNDEFHTSFSEGSTSGLRKAPPHEMKLPCTLEELYNGAVRKMKISRTVLNAEGLVY